MPGSSSSARLRARYWVRVSSLRSVSSSYRFSLFLFGGMDFKVNPASTHAYHTEGDLRKHGSPFPMTASPGEPKRVQDAIRALNDLAGFKLNNMDVQPPCRPPTKVQLDMLDHVRGCVSSNGRRPEDMTGQSAIRGLARNFSPYDGMPSNLADYDLDKVKILHSDVQPKQLVDLLPPQLQPLVSNFKRHIERDPLHVQADLAKDPDAMPKVPYWDSTLRSSPHERFRLYKRMFDKGLMDLQPVICAKAGIFFVKKKTPDWIRLIIDGRQANFHHRRPPVARLGSASCLSELRLQDIPCAYGQEMDVSDCFYQFRVDEAGAWFGLDEPMLASEWAELGIKVEDVYDRWVGRRRPLSGDESLYPTVSAMPMGWSWALYLANECVSYAVRQSAPSPMAELREKLPTPQLLEYTTVTSTYVDNVTVLGISYDEVEERARSIQQTFDDIGIPVVWTQKSPVQQLDSVGCVLDLLNGTISNKHSRVWRVYLGGLELARRGRVQVKLVEIWLGHVTSLFRLKPCLLSIFDKIYRFIDLGREKRWPLWPAVRREIRQACSLVWLTFTNLRPKIVNQVDAGDSADHGYALMTRGVSTYRIERMLKFKEKWRFSALPDDVNEALSRKDREGLVRALERHTGYLQETVSSNLQEHPSFVRFGFGLDTE